jgi:hypothetical protein
MFAFVPRNTEVLGLVDSTPTPLSNVPDTPIPQFLNRIYASLVSTPNLLSTPNLPSSHNLVRGIAALLQLLYTSYTFYRTIGGQVNQYGFAAPGFTVLPYAVMSGLNLMANLVAPHYPTLYLIRTKIMEEAERRRGSPFHYVVGEAVDESGTNNIVMEGWSEIAGSFKYEDELLYLSPSTEAEDDKIEICCSSQQTIYVPACPRFRRTDDSRTSPLRQFIESGLLRRLEFPRYMVARFSRFSILHRQQVAFRRRLSYLRSLAFMIIYTPLLTLKSKLLIDLFKSIDSTPFIESCITISISLTELFTIFALSNFTGQQSTLAQRAWTVTWLVNGCVSGIVLNSISSIVSKKRDESLISLLRIGIVSYCAPAIGGFVVVSQMLKAYGICYKFV